MSATPIAQDWKDPKLVDGDGQSLRNELKFPRGTSS